jgi:hypothetical protein
MAPRDDRLTSDELREVENDLRAIYARRDPAPSFTSRVMERVRAETARAPEPITKLPNEKRAREKPAMWRWAVAGAMAASLAVGVYVQQGRVRRAGAIADERAADQLMLALQLAGNKINKARDAAFYRSLGETAP